MIDLKTYLIRCSRGKCIKPSVCVVPVLYRFPRSLINSFELLWWSNSIPGQWLISKIIPVHKKGDKKCIENYRPVANLCSVSKIFEKLILKRINELEVINGIKVGGNQQHGFIRNKSTVTAGLLLQSLITRALVIPLEWLNLSIETFKVRCKKLLLWKMKYIWTRLWPL